MMTFDCSHCGQELTVQQTSHPYQGGRSITCTHCSQAVLVPAEPGHAPENSKYEIRNASLAEAGAAEAMTLPPQTQDTQATLPPKSAISNLQSAIPGITVDFAAAGGPGVSQQVSSPHGVAEKREDALPAIPGFEVLGVLGRGGMGVVYKARQAGLKRIVALKMILSGTYADQAQRARFVREAEAVARLQHANIVQIFQIGEHDGNPYFSLEYCDGGSLAEMLSGTPLPAADATHVVGLLTSAMHAAHQQNIIHRDLKPANILLGIRHSALGVSEAEKSSQPSATAAPPTNAECRIPVAFTPKITDFGLAKHLDDVGQTATGAVMGTPSYMAPEQASGETKTHGPAADIYALGAILYECLTGRPPFKAANSLETVMMVVGSEPVPPRELNPRIPRDLETICLKCLEKDPHKRYASPADLGADLARFEKGEPIAARPVGQVEKELALVPPQSRGGRLARPGRPGRGHRGRRCAPSIGSGDQRRS